MKGLRGAVSSGHAQIMLASRHKPTKSISMHAMLQHNSIAFVVTAAALAAALVVAPAAAVAAAQARVRT
jgi:hypothetical protein